VIGVAVLRATEDRGIVTCPTDADHPRAPVPVAMAAARANTPLRRRPAGIGPPAGEGARRRHGAGHARITMPQPLRSAEPSRARPGDAGIM